jgi:hypothetical protein
MAATKSYPKKMMEIAKILIAKVKTNHPQKFLRETAKTKP